MYNYRCFVDDGSYKNLTKHMCTININVVRGHSYENFSIQNFIIQSFIAQKFPNLRYFISPVLALLLHRCLPRLSPRPGPAYPGPSAPASDSQQLLQLCMYV